MGITAEVAQKSGFVNPNHFNPVEATTGIAVKKQASPRQLGRVPRYAASLGDISGV